MKKSLLFILIFLFSCTSIHDIKLISSGNLDIAEDDCLAADMHLANLCQANPSKNSYCCEVGAPTKKGKTYTQFCVEKYKQHINLNPSCIATIQNCGQINSCTNSD